VAGVDSAALDIAEIELDEGDAPLSVGLGFAGVTQACSTSSGASRSAAPGSSGARSCAWPPEPRGPRRSARPRPAVCKRAGAVTVHILCPPIRPPMRRPMRPPT